MDGPLFVPNRSILFYLSQEVIFLVEIYCIFLVSFSTRKMNPRKKSPLPILSIGGRWRWRRRLSLKQKRTVFRNMANATTTTARRPYCWASRIWTPPKHATAVLLHLYNSSSIVSICAGATVVTALTKRTRIVLLSNNDAGGATFSHPMKR